MKLECTKDKLRTAIALTERGTGKNMPLAVLGAIVLEAEDNRLVLKSTNLDIGLVVAIQARVEKKGRVGVPGSLLYQFIQNIPDNGVVVLEEVSANLHVSTPQTSTLIKGIPLDDFPKIPELTEEESLSTLELPLGVFLQGIRAVWYAAATIDIKPEIATVYIHAQDEFLVFTATDSFRLAEKRIALKKQKTELDQFTPTLIPIRNVGEILKVFDGVDTDMALTIGPTQAQIVTDSIFFTTRLITGTYPDLSQVYPQGATTSITVKKQDFIHALRAVNVFSDKFNRISFTIDPGENLFEIRSESGDVGESTVRVKASLSGESLSMNFNAKYLLDSFQSISGDEISLSFKTKDRPLVLKDRENPSFTYLLMPLHS